MNWMVKSRVTDRIFYGFHSLNEAMAKALEMNTIYQSDEYKVEAFDPAKAWR